METGRVPQPRKRKGLGLSGEPAAAGDSCAPPVACTTDAGIYCAVNVDITSVVGSSHGGSVYVVSTSVDNAFKGGSYCVYEGASDVKYSIKYTVSIGAPQPTAVPSLAPTAASTSTSFSQLNSTAVNLDNIQYYFIILFFFVYAIVGAMVARAREKDEKLAPLGLLDVSLSMGVQGVSLISELFYVSTLFISGSTYYSVCAAIILAAHLCHTVPAASVIASALEPCGIRGVYAHMVDKDTIFASDYFYGVITLMSLMDFYIVTLLPWRRNQFSERSFGFPSFGVFRTSVYLTVSQTLVSSAIQIYILISQKVRASESNILFAGVNLSLTVVSMMVAVIRAFLKINILVKHRDDSSLDGMESHQELSLACTRDVLCSGLSRVCRKISRCCSRLLSPAALMNRLTRKSDNASVDIETLGEDASERISEGGLELHSRISISTDFTTRNPMQTRRSTGAASARTSAMSGGPRPDSEETAALRAELREVRLAMQTEMREMKEAMALVLKSKKGSEASDDIEL